VIDYNDPLEIRRWLITQRDFYQRMIDAFDKMNSDEYLQEHALFFQREPARLEESYLNRVAEHPFEKPIKSREGEKTTPTDNWRFGNWRYETDGTVRKLESE